MTRFLRDLRYGARLLRRAPGFAMIAIITLALGLGANTAMFSIVDALLFRPPLGVADPGRLARIEIQLPAAPGEGPDLTGVLSYPDYVTLRDRARGFAGAAAYTRTGVTVGTGEDNRSEQALLVTGNYFRLLGVHVTLGRPIAPEDDRENAPVPVTVLSWDYWQRTMSGDRAAIGKPITINGHSFVVIGVAPKHFVGTELGAPALWLPLGVASMLGYDVRMTRSRFASWLSVVARLGNGVTRDQALAAAQAALLAARDAGEEPAPVGRPGGLPPGAEVRVQVGGPEREPGGPPPPRRVRLSGLAGQGRVGVPAFGAGRSLPVSLWFMAITAAVLLIACANVANLLLARAANRAHEMAVRLSLGARPARLVQQLMTESLLLALLGGGAGLALALVGVTLVPRVIPLPPLPPLIDARVLTFTAFLTLVTTVVFALAPARHASRLDLNRILSTAGRQRAARTIGRSALVVVQLATSLVLLVAAGLFVRSLHNVKAIDTGFDAEHVLTASVELRGAQFTPEQADEFWRRALERVQRIPGVRSAALGMAVPFQMNIMMPVDAPGFPAADGRPRPAQADFAGVGYFATLGIAIEQGRAFTDEDYAGATPVVIVNQTLAHRIWGGTSPIGKCIQADLIGSDAPCLTVVGVAADARYADITSEPHPFFYRPLAQRSREAPPLTVLHVRTVGDPLPLAGTIRRELQGLNQRVPFVAVRAMTDLIRPQIEPWRVGTLIFTLFGILGAVLAAVGLYGVLSFLVAQRTRELGLRLALGAQRRDVLALVLAQGTRLIAIGMLVGLLLAAAATRVFASMMYGVSPLDPVVYAATGAVLVLVALLAIYVPARRAMRVDPVVALRAE